MRKAIGLRWAIVAAGAAMLLSLAAACGTETVQVPGETVVVEKEVIKEVQVPGETVTVTKEVVKTVEVPGETVIKEVVKEVPVPGETVIKEVVKEIVKTVEVPGETVIKEVVKTVEVPVVVEKVVVKEVPVAMSIKGPRYGGTIRKVAKGGEPTGWNICQYTGQTQQHLSYNAEKFGMPDWSKGPSGSGEAGFTKGTGTASEQKAAMADSWDIPDPLTYRFHLRPGLRWQDKHPVWGREVTLEEIVAEYNRIVECRWPRHNYVDTVTGEDTDGDGIADSVVVRVNKPQGFWVYEMYDGPYLIFTPPESVEAGLGDWRNVAGTGPFTLVDYVPGSILRHEKNPDWYNTFDISGRDYALPFVDGVDLIIMPDPSSQLAAMRTGKIDQLEGVAAKDRAPLAASNPELISRLYPGSGLMFWMPVDKPPFDDIRVRKAMNLAFDRQAYIDGYLLGQGEIQSHPYTSDFPSLYQQLEEYPESIQEWYKYDPAKAKQLMADAGYAGGFEANLVLETRIDRIETSEIMAASWKEIGVDVTIIPLETAAFHTRVFEREYDIALQGLGGKLNVFHDFRLGTQWNLPNITDAKFNEMWNDIGATTDPVEQATKLKEISVYFLEMVACVCTPASMASPYWWPWLGNYSGETNPAFATVGPIWAHVWIDQDMREEMTGKR